MQLHNHKSGFALLMSLIVVSVVISVGLTLVDLTIKQLRLSSVSRDSEAAFHAANAGVECARYLRVASSNAFETAGNVTVNCFGTANQSVSPTSLGTAMSKYEFDVSWTVGSSQRCSTLTVITMSPSVLSSGVTLNNVPTHIPGYPFQTKSCPAGGRCTIISAQGYNQLCSTALSTGAYGVIQREVLLEL